MKSDELERIAERLRPIFEQHGVQRAIVFGSLARGEASRRSDLDLIVVMDTEQRFLDRYDALLAPIVCAVPERTADLLISYAGRTGTYGASPFYRGGVARGQDHL